MFNFRWLLDLVLQERRALRDIGIASFTVSFLTIFPPLLVMATVNKVLQFHSVSTLVLLSVDDGDRRRLRDDARLCAPPDHRVVGARLDAKLNLHVFNRLLRLPLDYFERHPAGETMYRIARSIGCANFSPGSCSPHSST